MRNTANRETVLMRDALVLLERSVPPRWGVSFLPHDSTESGIDGVLAVTSPAGGLTFGVGMPALGNRSAAAIVEQAKQRSHRHGLNPLLLVEYANPAFRSACQGAEISYLDTTGWMSIVADGPPGLALHREGAERSPVVRASEISRLDGPSASRVMRTLWKLNPTTGFPQGIRQLAAEAGVAPGTVSKILPTLESYGAIVRDDSGRVMSRDRRLLLDRWTQDYSFSRSHRRLGWYLAPRGLAAVEPHISRIPPGHRMRSTGPTAARNPITGAGLVPVLPQTLVSYYSEDIDLLAKFLGLAPAPPSGANVVLAEPRDLTDDDLLAPFGGAGTHVMPVPAPQTLADLLTMGGRYPDLADQMTEALSMFSS